jgi:hypothetical protein
LRNFYAKVAHYPEQRDTALALRLVVFLAKLDVCYTYVKHPHLFPSSLIPAGAIYLESADFYDCYLIPRKPAMWGQR